MQELELPMQDVRQDIIRIMEIWWNSIISGMQEMRDRCWSGVIETKTGGRSSAVQ